MTGVSPDLSLAERIDAICDQFEQDFRAGQQPRIESSLGESPEPFRSQVLRALVGLEVELRQTRGDHPSVEEYVSRFPNQAEAVQEAFAQGRSILSSVKVAAVETSKGPAAEPAVPATDSAVLQHLGRFQILSTLGEGAFGTVYKAHDPQLDRDVAIKVPRAGALLTADDRERFLREARAAAGLHHALICPVHEVGTIDGRDYIVMAFIDGKPLSKVIKSQSALSDRQIASVIRKISLALQEAHEKGIIHRDLKPANIMINRKGEPVIMDFGLARRDNAGDAQISQSGQIMGTPAYMSPEQARGDGKAVGPAADIYSLGVVFYEMLCGRRPFEGTITEVIGKILHVAADPPSEYRAGIDPRLQEICLKAIAKKSTDRYASMKDLAAALADYLKEPEKSVATETKLPAQTISSPATATDKQRNIQQFIQQGQLPAALEALKPLVSNPDLQLATWAKDQSAKIKTDIRKWQEQIPTLTALGHKLIRKCDYAEAKNILSQIPASLRPAEIQKTLEEAEEKQEECDLLQMEIDEALRKEYAKELPSLVKRFLQLKPGHKGMQKLAEEMKQYGADRAIRLRKGDRGRKQDTSSWNVKLIAAVAGGFAALFGGVLYAVLVYLTPYGTVIINVEDKNVAVTFANDEITLDSSGKKFKVKPTEKKTLKVLVDGIEIESETQEITVSKNETKLITAKLVSGKVELTVAGEAKPLAVPGKTPEQAPKVDPIVSSPPPQAVASSIPADAVSFNGHSYKFFPETISWTEAKRRCEQTGGHLPMVDSQEENDFLVKLCEGKFPQSDKIGGPTIWLGATDVEKEGEWKLIDGKPLAYKNWYKAGNQPNNGGGKGEHYATLLLADLPKLGEKAGGWSDQPDVPSQQDIYYICEWDSAGTSTAAAGPGWTELFNGKDLSNWIDTDGKPAAWRVENGYTEVTEKTKNIVTRENFPLDFELHVEFWVPKDFSRNDQARGNSGVYLHGRHEIQICDGYQNPISRPMTACGALYDEIAPSKNVCTAPETWQTFDITYHSPRVDGQKKVTTKGRLTIIHNGTNIIDNAEFEKIGGLNQNENLGQPGPIMLQNHGTPVRFRNIRIRPIEPQAAAANANGWSDLFNGKDLTGWKAVGSPKWSWSDNRLLGTPAPGGGAGYLMTEADYEDFELQLQFRLNTGLGSGLFLRTDPNGETTGRGSLEVQIADDDAFKLQPIGATGAVYSVFARKANPPLQRGDWNSLRARLNQRRIEVWVNDVQTVDADLDTAHDQFATNPGLNRRTGRIALQQNQKADVEYRNVRIRPLSAETSQIPADAQTFNGHAYKFFPNHLSWKDAKAKCEALGGHLIIVDSAEENAFAAKLVEAAKWEDAWVGATDEAKEADWRTVRGNPLPFTNWEATQPNNKQNSEHWALMSNKNFGQGPLGWKWSDQPNDSVQHKPGYLCEWDLLPAK